MHLKLLFRRPRIEAALSELDRNRLKLPIANPRLLFNDFDDLPVVLKTLPSGPWSSPIADIVYLAKIALCLRPRSVLEVGSFRGFTTRLLAEHTSREATIVAVDRDPRHGAAYRGTPLASKIVRRVGSIDSAMFAEDPPGKYDLIFLDADHTYDAVKHDTELLLPFLSPEGVFVWHDYANWGRFSGKNGVPEFLHHLARSRPIAAIGGSWLAIHAPAWALEEGARRLERAREDAERNAPGEDPWETESLRG